MIDKKNVKFISNNIDEMYHIIKKNLLKCKSFKLSVPFISFGGYQLFASIFNNLNNKQIKGQILITTYQDFIDPKIIEKFLQHNLFEIKIVDPSTIINQTISYNEYPNFWIFEFDDHYSVLPGLASLTEKTLKNNIEQPYLTKEKKIDDIVNEFNSIWNNIKELNSSFILDYKNRYYLWKKSLNLQNQKLLNQDRKIEPNTIQVEALNNLNNIRTRGSNKALVIAATGVGKTFLAAFDVKNVNPQRTLFIVHREEILKKAKESFELITNKKCSLYNGTNKDISGEIIFASIQTLTRHCQTFLKNTFDYIIVDEVHHIGAKSYQNVVNYFETKFLLGMSATPERSDGFDVFGFFDNEIAIDVRLKKAIDANVIVPFHYFGITDIEEASLDNMDIDKTDIDKIAKKLMINKRVEHIIRQIQTYGFDGTKMHCLGFCINKEHAIYMAKAFNEYGIISEALTSDTPNDIRKNIISRFENENDPLSVIFSVDIFNEGVDIPKVNLVLLLRPTESSIIFTQQLGRGLRKSDNKSFLTVLDFIGNHNKIYLIPYALMTINQTFNEQMFLEQIKNNFSAFSNVHIEFEEIAKEKILKSIGDINFTNEKFLKQEYYDFKKILDNKPILFMMEYLIEGSPDLIKIIKKYKSYLSFVAKVENDEIISSVLSNKIFVQYLEYFSSFLPLRRINEFAILYEIVKNNLDSIDSAKAKEIISGYISGIDYSSTIHALKNLNYEFLNDAQIKKQEYRIFNYTNNVYQLDQNFIKIINNSEYRKFILDCLDYGINKYLQDFGKTNYNKPFLKLHQTYSMKDVALCINYANKTSAFSMQGVFFVNNNFYFFVDLYKKESTKESLKYNDGIDINSRDIFYWESQNSTSQSSQIGQRIINHKKLGIDIHMFVRKYDLIKNQTQPYYYLGKVDVMSYAGSNPIKFKLKLHNEMNDEIFYEFLWKK